MNQDQDTLQLARPDFVGNLPDKLQLGQHAIVIDGIALSVTGETALRANANLFQGLLDGHVVALGNELGGIVDTLLHLLLVLHLGELAGHDAQDHVLVPRQLLKRSEASCTGSVEFEVVCVDVKFLEESRGNPIVASFREVAAANKVTTAEMDTDMHVSRTFGDAVVVQLDVLVKGLIGGTLIQRVGLPTRKHPLVTEICGLISPILGE